jgi:hypothetical protein
MTGWTDQAREASIAARHNANGKAPGQEAHHAALKAAQTRRANVAHNDHRHAVKAAEDALLRARSLHEVPKWANLKAVSNFYLAAAQSHGRYQVDHIVPLNGRKVMGLHVENNMQLLTPWQNKSKSNRFKS